MNNWNGYCYHCGEPSLSHIMSMFNQDLICPACKIAERKRPDYKQAESQDLADYAVRMEQAGCSPAQVASVLKLSEELLAGKL